MSKCSKRTGCECHQCRSGTSKTLSTLIDGTYPNATVTVRGGKIIGLRRGDNVFHSFAVDCPVETAAGEETGVTSDVLLEAGSNCVTVEGSGSSSNPFRIGLALIPGQLRCTDGGLGIHPDLISGATASVSGLTVANGQVTAMPLTLVTKVVNSATDLITVTTTPDGVVTIAPVDGGGSTLGKTKYTTYVPGLCNGPYAAWIDFVNGQYVLNIGGTASPVAPQTFPDLASAIAAVDNMGAVNDCVGEGG